FQRDFGGTQTIHSRVATAIHACSVRIDHECRQSIPARVVAGRPRNHHQLIGAVAVQHDGLVAIEYVAVAPRYGRGLDIAGVVAPLWFVTGQCKPGFTADDGPDPGLLLAV